MRHIMAGFILYLLACHCVAMDDERFLVTPLPSDASGESGSSVGESSPLVAGSTASQGCFSGCCNPNKGSYFQQGDVHVDVTGLWANCPYFYQYTALPVMKYIYQRRGCVGCSVLTLLIASAIGTTAWMIYEQITGRLPPIRDDYNATDVVRKERDIKDSYYQLSRLQHDPDFMAKIDFVDQPSPYFLVTANRSVYGDVFPRTYFLLCHSEKGKVLQSCIASLEEAVDHELRSVIALEYFLQRPDWLQWQRMLKLPKRWSFWFAGTLFEERRFEEGWFEGDGLCLENGLVYMCEEELDEAA